MTDSLASTKPLTTKQHAFVLAYVGEARFNATKAAKLAGYSEATAHSQGPRLLEHVEIAARIADELKARSLSAEGVLAELTDIATADWREFVEIRTNPKTGETIDVKMDLSNKVKSLELLAKSHGLLTDKIDLNANMTAQINLVGIAAEDV